jgi:hypothetical protein
VCREWTSTCQAFPFEVMMHLVSRHAALFPSKDVPWYLPADEDHPQ